MIVYSMSVSLQNIKCNEEKMLVKIRTGIFSVLCIMRPPLICTGESYPYVER